MTIPGGVVVSYERGTPVPETFCTGDMTHVALLLPSDNGTSSGHNLAVTV